MISRVHFDRDTLLDFVNGLGTEAERAAWLRHARTCPHCERDLRIASEDLGRARLELAGAVGQLENRFGGEVSAAPAPIAARAEAPRRARFPKWGLAGTLAAAAVVAMAVLRPAPPAPDLGRFLRPLPAGIELLTLRDPDATAQGDCLARGLESYGRADYRAAIGILENCASGADAETLRDLYLGSALAFTGRFESSLERLDRVATSPVPDEWRTEIEWTRGMAAFGAGRRGLADSLLVVIAARGPEDSARVAAFRSGVEPVR